MALQSKTISAKGSRDHHTFILTVTEDRTETSTNQSVLSFEFKLVDDNNWFWSAQGTYVSYKITIGSHTYEGYIPHHTDVTTNVRSESDISEIHNSDGTKTINIGFTVTDSSSIYYLPGNASSSSTMSLTTIPRASDVSVSAQTIANTSGTVTFTTTSKANFWHKYRYTINGTTSNWIDIGWINTTSQNTGINKTTILNLMPTIATATLTVEVATYSDAGTTLVGTKSASGTITITLTPSAPTLTTLGFRNRSSGVNSNITTPTAGYTTVALTTWSSGTSYGASSYTTYFSVDQGASLQTTSATANNTVIETNTLPSNAKQYTLTYTAYTVDSRGKQSANATKTVVVYGYSTPTLNLTAYRVASSSATTEDATGTYAYVTFSNTMRGQTDTNGALRSGNQNAIISAVCKYGSTTVTSGQHIALAVENTLTFTYTVQDRFTTTSTTRTVNSASFPLDLYDNGSGTVGAGFGTVAQGGWLDSNLKNGFYKLSILREHYANSPTATLSSSSGYAIIATFKITGTYANMPVYLVTSSRGREPSKIAIRWANVNGNDPDITTFAADKNNGNYWIYKSTTSTWQLITSYSGYDWPSITDIQMGKYMVDRLNVDYTMSYLNSVPSTAVGATTLGVNYADYSGTATNTDQVTLYNTDPSSATGYYMPFTAGLSGAGYWVRTNADIKCEIRAGTASTEGYVIFRVGNGTDKGVNGNKWGAIDIYPQYGANVCRIYANTTTAVRYISLPDASGTVVLNAVTTATGVVAKSSGGATLKSSTINIFGKVAQLNVVITGPSGSQTDGTKIFVGTISNTAYRPKASARGCDTYGTSALIGWITTGGEVNIRVMDAGTYDTDLEMAFTYIIA